MTDELSVIELILGASLTVKFVMATLVAASVTSWFMIVQRVIILQRANEELLDFEDRFWSGMDLAQLYREGSDAIEKVSISPVVRRCSERASKSFRSCPASPIWMPRRWLRALAGQCVLP